jgi:hypothetical protein
MLPVRASRAGKISVAAPWFETFECGADAFDDTTGE